MFNSREDLVSDLWDWLERDDVLSEARQLLGSGSGSRRSGLGKNQIGNWRRRKDKKLPDTFIEGAALHHCGDRATKYSFDATEMPGMKAESYWEFYYVRNDGKGCPPEWLNCGIIRVWQNVQTQENPVGYLTHIAHRSVGGIDQNCEPASDDEQVVRDPDPEPLGMIAGFEHEYDPDGSLFVSWAIEPHDKPMGCIGYAVDFPAAIRDGHDEAVGGGPTIAVGAAHQLVVVPAEAVKRLKGLRLPGNPQGIPSAWACLPVGDPVRIMEGYLQLIKDDAKPDGSRRDYFRRLGPWFRQGHAAVSRGAGRHEPPQAVQGHNLYKEAMKFVREGRGEVFSTRIDRPLPFLKYMLTF